MTRRRQRGQTLIIIFIALLLAGGIASSSLILGGKRIHDLRARIHELVPDAGRRAALDPVLQAMENEEKRLAAGLKAHEREVLALMERHDATAQDFRALAARADPAASHGALLDLRFALRAGLTADEWRALFAPRPR